MTARPESPTAAARAPLIAGLLLAGGRGSRFDPSGQSDKLMVGWRGQPLASHAAQLLKSACDPCLAILPPGKPALKALLMREGLGTVVSDKVLDGLGASLAAGVHELVQRVQPDAIVVTLADMPAIRHSTLAKLIDAWRERGGPGLAAAPFFGDQRGHPVIFGSDLFSSLNALTGDRGAGQMLAPSRLLAIAVDDPGVLRDVDTIEDLKRMDRPYGEPSPE